MCSIEQSLAASTLRCAHAVFLASLSSLAYLASGCSAALRTRRLSSLACLTSVCSDLRFWSLWRRRCSLAVALSYRSRRNLSLALCSTCAKLYPFVQFKYSVYGRSYRTYTRILQCSHTSVGLAQARPNHSSTSTLRQ